MMTYNPVQSAAPSPVTLYLLGSFRLEAGGHPVRLPTRKAESLLAYLALHPVPGGHDREKIAALFWGDSSDEDARRSLRGALFALRKALGDACLLADRDRVGINPAWPLWVDAQEVAEHAAAALQGEAADLPDLCIERYSGDLLPSFADEWIALERERIRSLHLRAMLHVARSRQARDDHQTSLRLASRVLELDPAEEAAHQLLIASYVALGDRGAAVRQCEVCERALREKWGIEPSTQMLALCRSARTAAQEPVFTPPPSNLPVPLTSFVGRQAELATVKALLSTARLVTLTGAGGSGKTRLAVEAATHLVGAFGGGVWWVDLAPLTDGALVARVVARTVGAQDAPQRSPTAAIAERLAGQNALLVFDNCEHLIQSCAQLVSELLSACPGVRVLATSRESLGVPGEQVWLVPTLSVPAASTPPDVETFQNCEAIKLFVARAASQQPDFRLAPQNAADIAAICRRLDGMPLGIELAASRIRVLSPSQIAQRLDHRFALLTGGSRTVLPRQRTLQAAVDWSYDLLADPERRLLRRLAVFAGGWSLAAAERVCTDAQSLASDQALIGGETVLDLLGRLVDKSLVLAAETGGEARFNFLETIREYAAARLAEAGETETYRARQAAFYAELSEEGYRGLHGAGQLAWLDRLDADHDNLRAALTWLLAAAPVEIEPRCTALRIAGALARFWDQRDHFVEGQQWLAQVLAATSDCAAAPVADFARALYGAGTMAWRQGEYERAYDYHARSAACCQEAGDLAGLARAWQSMAVQLNVQGERLRSESLLAESIALARRCGTAWDLATGLASVAWMALSAGDLSRAATTAAESAALYRRLGGEVNLYVPISVLVDVEILRGNYERATDSLNEALALARACRNARFLADALQSQGALLRRQGQLAASVAAYRTGLSVLRSAPEKYEIARALDGLGLTLAAQGRPAEAARLFSAAEALRQEMHVELWRVLRDEYEVTLAQLQSELGAPALAAIWAEGRGLSVPKAIEYCLEITA